MPYKTVKSVLQTRDGYLWAATSDGLARFDGVSFTVFNTVNSPGLKTNRLAETADGSLWISSEGTELFRLRGGVFSALSTAEGLPSNTIHSIYADRKANRLKILTQNEITVWENEKIVASLTDYPWIPYSTFDNTGAFCMPEASSGKARWDATLNARLPYIIRI